LRSDSAQLFQVLSRQVAQGFVAVAGEQDPNKAAVACAWLFSNEPPSCRPLH
jgi:hypothetical protein